MITYAADIIYLYRKIKVILVWPNDPLKIYTVHNHNTRFSLNHSEEICLNIFEFRTSLYFPQEETIKINENINVTWKYLKFKLCNIVTDYFVDKWTVLSGLT